MQLQKRVYTSANEYSYLAILKASIKGYVNSFYLAKQLAKRDIKAQYRQSVFGIFWAIAPLVINSLVWIFLQGSGTINLSATSIPYPLFVIVGTTLWSMLNECINLPIQSVQSNKGILTKINFDKEALITLGLLKFLFNLCIKIGIVIAFMIYFQHAPSIDILWFIPLLVISITFFVNIGIILTPIGLLFTDVSKMIPITLQLLMYATPVVYLMPKKGIMKTIMEINPLSYWITDLRNILTGYSIEHPMFWIAFAFITFLLSMISLVIYRVSIPIITERMSS